MMLGPRIQSSPGWFTPSSVTPSSSMILSSALGSNSPTEVLMPSSLVLQAVWPHVALLREGGERKVRRAEPCIQPWENKR